MITIRDFMETVDYRITEGSEYMWSCFGPTSYSLDSWNGRHDDEGYTVTIVFDTVTQVVYQMEAWDYRREREYRWINPEYLDAIKEESDKRGCEFAESLDDRKFVDLETAEDMLVKARAIVLGEEYDSRVSIPINMPEEELFVLMKMAHEQDITFNQLMVNVLMAAIEKDTV